ncbi:MAG TPA: hypothetical protein VGN88_10460 [Phycisphaerae bacterium]
MPHYFAHGYDQLHESSVKVSADSDEEAYDLAKRQLSVVLRMERFKPDGTSTQLTGPFGSPKAAAEKPDEGRRPPPVKRETTGNELANRVMFILLAVLLLATCGKLISDSRDRPKPSTALNRP